MFVHAAPLNWSGAIASSSLVVVKVGVGLNNKYLLALLRLLLLVV